ncbi:Uncharacterized protein FWK35_00017428, partial [Aphis craccivora]
QIYAQRITFSSISLKISVNRLIIKLSGKNIIYISMLVFYDYLVLIRRRQHIRVLCPIKY